MEGYRIMIVDDEEVILESIRDYMAGYDVRTYRDPAAAIESLDREYYDVLVCDYRMPGINGLDLLRRAREKGAYHYGVLLTAFADKDLLGDCINDGLIRKVIEKPLRLEHFRATIDTALKSCEISREERDRAERLKLLCREAFRGLGFLNDTIIGIDGGLREVFRKAEYIAPTGENVLVTGETGTGKEALARAIHHMSPRGGDPFVKINCGAIPESLMESELFGYSRGAFSGADREKPGKIELAHGGTLFLDEIGELSPEMQTRLLHVVQEKYVERLGSVKRTAVDFRLVCATNRNLAASIQEGRFREDLYYRISTFPIHVPPLRDRAGDIEPLARYLVEKYSRELGRKGIAIGPGAVSILERYPWPGNVRELENVIKRAMLQLPAGEAAITAGVFEYLFFVPRNDPDALGHAVEVLRDGIIKKKIDLKSLEREIIASILSHYDGNIMEAVRVTGIPKDRFYRNR